MSVRHRRRAAHAETIAPWAALSFILLIWWVGAKTLDWVKAGPQPPVMSFAERVDRSDPVDTLPPDPALRPRKSPTEATISANTMVSNSDLASLRSRSLTIPVRGLEADDLVSSFHDARGSRRHEAIDILAPRGTDVLAVENGKVAKLFTSKAGGLTIYQFDPSEAFVYYYAHLDRYAPGLTEGAMRAEG